MPISSLSPNNHQFLVIETGIAPRLKLFRVRDVQMSSLDKNLRYFVNRFELKRSNMTGFEAYLA